MYLVFYFCLASGALCHCALASSHHIFSVCELSGDLFCYPPSLGQVCFSECSFHHLCAICGSDGDRDCILDFQYCCAGGPFRAHWISLLWFFTILWLDMIITHGSNEKGFVSFSIWSISILALAHRSASMLSHASHWRTVGWPLSWCPLICWNFTRHGSCAIMCLHALRRSTWAANGSMVFLLLNLSRTDFPSQATIRVPCIGLSFTRYHTVNRRLYNLATLLQKELWSPC